MLTKLVEMIFFLKAQKVSFDHFWELNPKVMWNSGDMPCIYRHTTMKDGDIICAIAVKPTEAHCVRDLKGMRERFKGFVLGRI